MVEPSTEDGRVPRARRPRKAQTMKKLLPIGTLGLAGLVGAGLMTLPGSTVASGLGDDVAAKREDNVTELVLVDDDDNDDTNDDTKDTQDTQQTRSKVTGGDQTNTVQTKDSTRGGARDVSMVTNDGTRDGTRDNSMVTNDSTRDGTRDGVSRDLTHDLTGASRDVSQTNPTR